MSDRQLSALALVPAIALFAACFVARDSSPTASPRSPESRPRRQTPRLDGAAVLDRDALICAVLAQNSDLAAAEHAIEAARAGVLRPAVADTTRVDIAIAPASLGRDVPVGYLIEVGQSFRLGQRNLERRIASSVARSASHRRDEVRNELARTAATLFDDHFELGRALETNAEHRSLVTQLVDDATRRYGAGIGSAQDPLQAELELARVDQERIALETERKIVNARTNRLLHRPPDAPLPPAPDRLTTRRAMHDGTDVRAGALASRPEIRRAQTDAEARTLSVALARRRFAPNLGANVSYNSMWADVEHRFMMGIGLMIPLQVSSLRAGVTEAEASAKAAQRSLDAEHDRVAAEVEEALVLLHAAEQDAGLYRERLLPIARERVAAARIGYESGSNDLDVLIDAARELRTLELAADRALARIDRQRAEVDWAAGVTPCAQDVVTP